MAGKKSGNLDPIGKKIKKARTQKKYSFEKIANETGLAVDYLKNIESGKKTPSVGTLLQIARALELDSSFFLKEKEASLENRIEAYTKRTDNYAYKTLTPDAENKHLKAFRIAIDPLQDHQGVGYCHEGEEFIYVMAGKIEVVVGEHRNTLGKDESLHFNSGIKHLLRNISQEKAELLVVVYSP
ncbi:MAG: helix-turn-helix domain-containing protein [Proteobacteria bacterium]|nr:helix-turn-helix domain-containing protein [Pseudomonadota bacterium]